MKIEREWTPADLTWLATTLPEVPPFTTEFGWNGPENQMHLFLRRGDWRQPCFDLTADEAQKLHDLLPEVIAVMRSARKVQGAQPEGQAPVPS